VQNMTTIVNFLKYPTMCPLFEIMPSPNGPHSKILEQPLLEQSFVRLPVLTPIHRGLLISFHAGAINHPRCNCTASSCTARHAASSADQLLVRTSTLIMACSQCVR